MQKAQLKYKVKSMNKRPSHQVFKWTAQKNYIAARLFFAWFQQQRGITKTKKLKNKMFFEIRSIFKKHKYTKNAHNFLYWRLRYFNNSSFKKLKLKGRKYYRTDLQQFFLPVSYRGHKNKLSLRNYPNWQLQKNNLFLSKQLHDVAFYKSKKIYFELTSFNKTKLTSNVNNVLFYYKKWLKKYNITLTTKPIVLKTKKLVVLTSPHVNKVAQQHMENRSYSQKLVFLINDKVMFNSFLTFINLIIKYLDKQIHIKIFIKNQ